MATNFGNSSPFNDPNYDWRNTINSAFTQQGKSPYYNAEQMAIKPLTPMEQLEKTFGSVDGYRAAQGAPGASMTSTAYPQGGAGGTGNPYLQGGGGGGQGGNPLDWSPVNRNADQMARQALQQRGRQDGNPNLGGGHPMSAPGVQNGGQSASLPGYGMGSNPFQGAQANAMQTAAMDQFRQYQNQIAGNSVSTGGLGGSRQGVAEAGAFNDIQKNLYGALGNMYSNNWNQDQNRDLQNRGMDIQMRGQDIGWQNNVNNYQLGLGQLDQNGIRLGADLGHMAMVDSWYPYMAANSIYGTYGNNGTTTNSSSSGGGLMGAVGGGLAGASLYNQYGRRS
jgi:hypothetical protein